MTRGVEERIVGQSAPPVPLVARGKFSDGETQEWDVISVISIERTFENGSRDTEHDVTIILDGGHVARFTEAIHEMPDGLWAEWEIVHV